MSDPRRSLPSVDRLLQLPEVASLLERYPRNLVVAAARDALASARTARAPVPEDWSAELLERVRDRDRRSLVRVINATGVVLHTNLGRAPLADEAIEAMAAIARGFSNLELDLATGARGSRLDHCAALLAAVAGTESAMVVNNAAGALVLALNALAGGREVVISRGELIEIGGSFRIPEILEKSGARLREVGTTNRTHLADYEAAIGEQTGAILVVHRSNFAMTGFVASPEPRELALLGRNKGIPLVHDVGSGLLIDLAPFGLSGEPIVPRAAATADLVVWSGDKLLGGPQAGCLAGLRSVISRLARNPFARAMRADKLTLAALEATLRLYREPASAIESVPVLRMLTMTPAALERRARRLETAIAPRGAPRLEPSRSAVGGGAFPDAVLPTTVVTIDPGKGGAAALALALRLGPESVLTRIENGRVVLDPRTIPEAELDTVARAVADALALE